MGYDAKIHTVVKRTKRIIPYATGEIDEENVPEIKYITAWETTEVPAIETITPLGSSGGNISSSSGGGGGGDNKPEIKSATGERYKQVEEDLDDLAKKFDEVGRRKNRAFGLNKIKQLQKEIELLEKEADL